MKKRRAVYLPKWQRAFMLPMLAIILALVTYQEFFSQSEEQLGLVGYGLFVLLFVGLAIMFWLMSSGKLPAYIIEEEGDRE